MSVTLPQEIFRKTHPNSRDNLEPSKVPDKRFRELLQVAPIDEESHKKDFFSMIEDEKDEDKTCSDVEVPLVQPLALLAIQSQASSAAAVQNILSAEIEALFEKMASNMIVMSSSGEVETTVFLDNPQSVFFGTRITIKEFSTAPKAFNIEIASSTQCINAIEASKNGLLAAFQNGKFNFSVHRLDTHIRTEDRPVLHRKENEDRDHHEKGSRE